MTPKELLALLKLPVANTLYNTLHELRHEARIDRQALAGYPPGQICSPLRLPFTGGGDFLAPKLGLGVHHWEALLPRRA